VDADPGACIQPVTPSARGRGQALTSEVSDFRRAARGLCHGRDTGCLPATAAAEARRSLHGPPAARSAQLAGCSAAAGQVASQLRSCGAGGASPKARGAACRRERGAESTTPPGDCPRPIPRLPPA
jgi:hypothetical protein